MKSFDVCRELEQAITIPDGEKIVFIWDGDQLVMGLSDSGKVQKRYIRGNDRGYGSNLVYADKGDNTEKQYYVTDPHGNVVQLTDENGKVIKTYEYDSFGNEVNPDNKDEDPFRYCGEYYDKETEEIYLRARYYEPEVGRFLTRDTYTGEEDEPESLHLYTYCYNNPVAYSDNGGNCPIVDWVKSFCNWITGGNKSNNNKSKVTPKPTTMPTPVGPRPLTRKKAFKITKKQLKKLGWKKSARTKKSVRNLNVALKKYKMNKVKIVRHFIAQCMFESNCGYSCSEADYLSNKAIRKYCAQYDYRKDLGNNKKGDGYKYRGVGYIQVTGKNVITKFAKEVSNNKIKKEGTTYIINHGDKYLWSISCFWWVTHIPKSFFKGSKNVSADEISKKVNYYDTKTFGKRRKNYYKCCKIIK